MVNSGGWTRKVTFLSRGAFVLHLVVATLRGSIKVRYRYGLMDITHMG